LDIFLEENSSLIKRMMLYSCSYVHRTWTSHLTKVGSPGMKVKKSKRNWMKKSERKWKEVNGFASNLRLFTISYTGENLWTCKPADVLELERWTCLGRPVSGVQCGVGTPSAGGYLHGCHCSCVCPEIWNSPTIVNCFTLSRRNSPTRLRLQAPQVQQPIHDTRQLVPLSCYQTSDSIQAQTSEISLFI
jgi:hypothetical protein